jgi:hypothetical protein
MKVVAACGLEWTKLSTEQNVKIFEKGYLTNDHNLLSQNILQSGMVSAMGRRMVDSFNNKPFFFQEADYEFAKNISGEEIDRVSSSIRKTLSRIVFFTWFFKDSSSDLNTLYLLAENRGHESYERKVYSNCLGKQIETTFTDDEFKSAAALYARYSSIATINEFEEMKVGSESPKRAADINVHDFNYHILNRMERAINFLEFARATPFLPLKISFYVCAHEALFSTDNLEVTHKISERVAYYIGGDYIDRLDTFKKMKKAYSIRSNYFHGQDFLNVKKADLEIAAKSIDEITRRVLRQAITEDIDIFAYNNSKLSELFRDLALGGTLRED